MSSAIQDFHRARRRAVMEEMMGRVTGKSIDLLSYEDVLKKLKTKGRASKGLRDIPLDAIVGSVGRYTDFTRSFLPRQNESRTRWARVDAVASGLVGLPPIEVYRVGDVYFVLDGNHRVSVARQMGASHIQAYVTEITTKVPLTPDVQPDDLILKAEYAAFLERTDLDNLRPEADLSVSLPGQYPIVEEHIEVHRYFMGIDEQRDISYQEAVGHWYDTIYMPVVEVIRERGILRDFPGRTETDLYIWALRHRVELEEELGWHVDSTAAAVDLAARSSPRLQRVIARLGGKILDAIMPDELEDGPPAGRWRETQLMGKGDQRLFDNILVPVSGQVNGWCALDQAAIVARYEGSRLLGLHVVPSKDEIDNQPTNVVRDEFNRRCQMAGIEGEFAFGEGSVSNLICNRAQWTDLVVVNVSYPPSPQPIARLISGFRAVIRRCPGPVLTVPGTAYQPGRALLAYDASHKAREALFVATYIAGQWGVALTVLTVVETGGAGSNTMSEAREYLEKHGIDADYVEMSGPVESAILDTANASQSDWIIMGGYGFSPMLEVVLGSAVDGVLRGSSRPVLICR